MYRCESGFVGAGGVAEAATHRAAALAPRQVQARFGAALLEADRERVMQRVQAICEVLNAAQPPSYRV